MNKIVLVIISLVIVGGGAFYGGIKYQERNFSPEEIIERMQETGMGANMGNIAGDHVRNYSRGDSMSGVAMIVGEIISQDEDSFTIKLNDDSTRIIFINESTQITKSVNGVSADLEQGKQVFLNGSENPDGSYTAQIIQLRP